MAGVDLFGNPVDDQWGPMVTPAPPGSDVTPPGTGRTPDITTTSGPGGPAPFGVEDLISRDTGAWRGMLQDATKGLNFGDPMKAADEELGGVLNWVRANPGADPRGGVDEAIARIRRRGAPTPGGDRNIPGGGNNNGGGTGGPGTFTGTTTNQPPNQFTDPYTRYLEEMAKQNIGRLQNNPQLTQLMDFLNKKFGELSTANGYTPDELAMLRTQAIDPIMRSRDAAQRRNLERASALGYLPSSGLTGALAADIDRGAMQAEAEAQRAIGINNIGQKRTQVADALNLGQIALQVPQQQDAQALGIAQMLYQLPRNAMQDALMVINSASPNSALASLLGVQNQAFNQNLVNQQQQNALWALLGQIFGQSVGS